MEVLASRKDAVVSEWLARALATYPAHTARVLARETDPFRNPVGHAFRDTLPRLFDAVLQGADPEVARQDVERLVRIRAVQEFTPAGAVAFVFLLKDVVRDVLGEIAPDGASETLRLVDRRTDELALLAFEALVRCRDDIARIKLDESRRRLGLLVRMRGAETVSEPSGVP